MRSSSCYDMKVNRWLFTSTSLIMRGETSMRVAEWLFEGDLGDGFQRDYVAHQSKGMSYFSGG